MRSVEINGSTIHFLPVVKGLVSEGDAVEKAINEENPDAIAISISKEELAALGNKEDYDKYEPSDIEEIYSVLLENVRRGQDPPALLREGAWTSALRRTSPWSRST